MAEDKNNKKNKKHTIDYDDDFISNLDDLSFDEDDDDIDSYYSDKEDEEAKGRRKKSMTLLAVLAIVVCAMGVAGILITTIIDKYTPSKETVTLYEYYGADAANDIAETPVSPIYMNGELIASKAYLINGVWYFDKDTVDTYFTKRFYYDEGNNELIFTTPSKILTIPFDSQVYYLDKENRKESYCIARKIDDVIYIAVDFVKGRADFIYEVRTMPYRMVLTTEYGVSTYASISEEANIRLEANIKAAILSTGQGSYNWKEDAIDGDWTKLVTDDGQVGYVRSKEIVGTYNVTTSNVFQAPVYTSLTKNYKLNLVWHAVYSISENETIYRYLDAADGVTTVSPTWYQITDAEGNFSSYAEQWYVDYIHSEGLEIWPLISDFISVDPENGWDETELLGNTENRRNLIRNIMNEIETFGYDGINIDFEKITKENGENYVEFLRELSIECRKAGVVLSIDDYVPMPHTAHYDRHEQGIIADYVIVMGYDEHYDGSEPGSVSSVGFVTAGIERTLAEVPNNKVINALPFYTRMWIDGVDENGVSYQKTKAYSMSGALSLVDEYDFDKTWDDEVCQYVASGKIDNATYQVWLEDDKSIEAKMKIVQQYKIGGVAAWSLGSELESVWNIINSYNHE